MTIDLTDMERLVELVRLVVEDETTTYKTRRQRSAAKAYQAYLEREKARGRGPA